MAKDFVFFRFKEIVMKFGESAKNMRRYFSIFVNINKA